LENIMVQVILILYCVSSPDLQRNGYLTQLF